MAWFLCPCLIFIPIYHVIIAYIPVFPIRLSACAQKEWFIGVGILLDSPVPLMNKEQPLLS